MTNNQSQNESKKIRAEILKILKILMRKWEKRYNESAKVQKAQSKKDQVGTKPNGEMK